jgi:hypothetical protein
MPATGITGIKSTPPIETPKGFNVNGRFAGNVSSSARLEGKHPCLPLLAFSAFLAPLRLCVFAGNPYINTVNKQRRSP